MSQTDPFQKLLAKIKKLPLREAEVNLYLGENYSGNKRKNVYKVARVNRDDSIAKKLRSALVKRIEEANGLKEYEPISEDQDGSILVGNVNTNETEWASLAKKITEAEGKEVPKLEDLIGANFYVVELVLSPESLYAVTRLHEKWTAQRTSGYQTIFKGGKLIDAEGGKVFRFENHTDFIFFDDSFLILNKGNFEKVLNNREGMKRSADEVIEELGQLGKFEGLQAVREHAGDKMPALRRLATIRKAGLFREADFMEKLFEVVKEFGWDIEFNQDGKIIITPENMDTVLHLLANNRVTSVIDQKMFDALVKKEVGPT